MFVGNIDKTIPNEELKKYFLNLYTSIISVKIIFDQETGKSKGFGFVEFTNYREFNKPVYLGKQKLVFNSGKNKYNNYDEYKPIMNKNIITHSDSTNSFNLTQLSTETGNSFFNNSNRNSINSFIEDNNKPTIKKVFVRNEDEQFQIDVNNAFNNISEMAFYSGKGDLNQCNYYCNYFMKKNNSEYYCNEREFNGNCFNYNKFENSQIYNNNFV